MNGMMNKLEASKEKVKSWCAAAQKPAILCSFGKDSLVIVHLTRELGLKLPIIYHRNHWFPEKNAFADEMTQLWQLEVHDWPPTMCGIKVHDTAHGEPGLAGTTEQGCIQTVSRYQIGPGIGMDVPNGILEPVEGEPWLCARTEIIERPKGSFEHPWDLCFSGHKSCDEDIFEGPCPLRSDSHRLSETGPVFAFPLADWSTTDVWNYIEEFRLPLQRNRYDAAHRAEWPDKRFNNDYVRACTRCLDRRQPATVFCPKVGHEIPNVSARVLNLELAEVGYIDR